MRIPFIALFATLLVFTIFASFASATTTIRVPALGPADIGIVTNLSATHLQPTGELSGVFVDVEPYISVETQESAKIAAALAANLSRVTDPYLILYRIHADAETIDGPSGGVSMLLLAYAELSGLHLRSDVAATGAIDKNGKVGKIGGVREKLDALGKDGVKIFIVPFGQAHEDGADLVAYGNLKYGMNVIEVQRGSDAIAIAFSKEGTNVTAPVYVEKPLVLKKLTPRNQESILAIAQDSLAALEKDISDSTLNQIAKMLWMKQLNTTHYLVDQGYYYSAANVVFLSRIGFDSYMLSNISKSDFTSKVTALQQSVQATDKDQLTTKNIELFMGARMRFYWAKEKVTAIVEDMKTVPHKSLLTEYVSAANWKNAYVALRKQQLAVSGGEPLNQESFKNIAKKALVEASDIAQDDESKRHVRTAKLAYDAGEYAVAFFDARFALAYSHADIDLQNKDPEELLEKPVAYSALWPQSYEDNALYSLAQYEQNDDASSLENAVRLQYLAKELNGALEELKLESQMPIQEEPQLQPVVQITKEDSTKDIVVKASVALLLAIFIAVAYVAIKIRPRNSVNKAEMAEKAFLAGKINQKTYERLAKKYGKPEKHGINKKGKSKV